MTWDWIADTLYMIEQDLRGRHSLCPGVAKRDTEAALRGVISAREHIRDAILLTQKLRDRAVAAEQPGETNDIF